VQELVFSALKYLRGFAEQTMNLVKLQTLNLKPKIWVPGKVEHIADFEIIK
jgi:hypothetical protein